MIDELEKNIELQASRWIIRHQYSRTREGPGLLHPLDEEAKLQQLTGGSALLW